jgi:hypothetical protein
MSSLKSCKVLNVPEIGEILTKEDIPTTPKHDPEDEKAREPKSSENLSNASLAIVSLYC